MAEIYSMRCKWLAVTHYWSTPKARALRLASSPPRSSSASDWDLSFENTRSSLGTHEGGSGECRPYERAQRKTDWIIPQQGSILKRVASLSNRKPRGRISGHVGKTVRGFSIESHAQMHSAVWTRWGSLASRANHLSLSFWSLVFCGKHRQDRAVAISLRGDLM